MKQPFWILNSTLLLMLFCALLLVLFSRVKVPRRQDIEPYSYSMPEENQAEKIDLGVIYKNDLFNTYQPFVPEMEKSETEELMPVAPTPVQPNIPEPTTPQFFEPLAITLTGIIILNEESKNKAIIMDNKTQQQVNYKVGDEIEDAQIIRILKNKVILIRSNGQQEILYLRAEDAKNDNPNPNNELIEKNIVRQISDDLYFIDPVKFAKYVKNVGEFIDLFNLSTAYRQGKNIGTIIRRLEHDSLGSHMGLQAGDIIETINDIPADSTDNKMKIYEKIISMQENDTIEVNILRNDDLISITYKLKSLKKDKIKKSSEVINQFDKMQEDKIEAEKIRILKEKYKFAPTVEEIKLREKQNMLKSKVPLKEKQ